MFALLQPNPQRCTRKAVSRLISATALAAALAASAQAFAQTALDSASVSKTSASGSVQSNLQIVKVGKDGGFVITITNKSTESISGAVVSEKVGGGLPCPAENSVEIQGSGAPIGSYSIAVLISSGIQLGTLQAGQSVTLTYSCDAS